MVDMAPFDPVVCIIVKGVVPCMSLSPIPALSFYTEQSASSIVLTSLTTLTVLIVTQREPIEQDTKLKELLYALYDCNVYNLCS